MTSYILVVFIYVGMLTEGEAVTLQTIPGWKSKEACESAGKQLKPLVSGTTKELNYVCISNN